MNGITIDLKAAGVVVSTVDSAWDNCLSNWSISCFIFAIINSNLKMSVKYNIEWKKIFFLNRSKLKLHTLRMIKALKVSYTSMWYVLQIFLYICYTEFDQSGSWLKLLCRSSKFHQVLCIFPCSIPGSSKKLPKSLNHYSKKNNLNADILL